MSHPNYDLLEDMEEEENPLPEFSNLSLSSFLSNSNFDVEVFKCFLRAKSLIPNQLSSFNNMSQHLLPEIINNDTPITLNLPSPAKDGTTLQFIVTFSNLFFATPRTYYSREFKESKLLYPYESRNRNITYESSMFIDIDVDGPRGRKKFERVPFGSIPVMIKSNLCNLFPFKDTPEDLYSKYEDPQDPGGYFILGSKKGSASEKVVICQERHVFNRVAVYGPSVKLKFECYSQIRSVAPRSFYPKILRVGFQKGLIVVALPYLPDKNNIPISIMFRALGATTERDIMNHILDVMDDPYATSMIEAMIPSLEYGYLYKKQEECLEYIGCKGKKFESEKGNKYTEKDEDDHIDEDVLDPIEEDEEINKTKKQKLSKKEQAISYARYLITTEVLPHIGKNFVKKRYFLGYMVRKLLLIHLGKLNSEDRDHYANKRVNMVGDMMAGIFYTTFRKMKTDMKKAIDKKGSECINYGTINVVDYLKVKSFSDQFASCLGSGNWGSGKGQKTGVSQVFDRLNYIASWAHLRRINTPMSGEGKIEEPRRLHNSHWMYTCPSETPESKQCGLVKALSLMSYISLETKTFPLKKILKQLGLITFKVKTSSNQDNTESNFLTNTKVFINGDWVGIFYDQDIDRIYSTLRSFKLSGQIFEETSIIYDTILNELRLSTEMGRFIRPLLVVRNGEIQLTKRDIEDIKEKRKTWYDLIHDGIIELVDAEESDDSRTYIANYYKDVTRAHTHCEIHPALMYGLGGTLICKPECNQSPRVCYQCSMIRQAFNRPSSNYMFRNTGTQYILNYLQRPLISSKFAEIFGDAGYGGNNAMVAIMNYRGYGQEDSIIINKQSVERGFFDTMCFVDYRTQVKKHEKQILEIPTNELCHETIGRVTNILNNTKDEERNNFITIKSQTYKTSTTKTDPVPYGVARVGSIVYKGDIIIAKLKEKSAKEKRPDEKPYKNESIVFKDFKVGRVCSVQYGNDGDGFLYINVKIAEIRLPEIGDKWASKISQKGTCGLMANQEDLPFSGDSFSALQPDLILNPLAFPSRMTISHLIEALAAKKVCSSSREHYKILDKHVFYSIKHNGTNESLRVVDDFEYDNSMITDESTFILFIKRKVTHNIELLEQTLIDKVFEKGYSTGVFSYSLLKNIDVPREIVEELYSKYNIREKYGPAIEDGTAYEKIKDIDIQRVFGENKHSAENITLTDLFKKELKKLGYEPHGHQKLYCGMTGEPIDALIFFAPTYYQRLRHLVANKMHARSRGPNQALNRQPQEGRANDGGLRCGEMERDCLLAQSAAFNIRERLCEKSDKFNTFVCRHCGLFAINNKTSGIKECRACDVEGDEHIVDIQMPYTTKLAFQELTSINIVPRILT